MDDPALERDLWQQGGNPLLFITLYISSRAREKALELDQRTVYRKTGRGWEQVAVFKNVMDAASAVSQHNLLVNEKSFEKLHDRIGSLIQKLDSDTLGDPTI